MQVVWHQAVDEEMHTVPFPQPPQLLHGCSSNAIMPKRLGAGMGARRDHDRVRGGVIELGQAQCRHGPMMPSAAENNKEMHVEGDVGLPVGRDRSIPVGSPPLAPHSGHELGGIWPAGRHHGARTDGQPVAYISLRAA